MAPETALGMPVFAGSPPAHPGEAGPRPAQGQSLHASGTVFNAHSYKGLQRTNCPCQMASSQGSPEALRMIIESHAQRERCSASQHYSPFTLGKVEAQEEKVTSPRSPAETVAELGTEPRSSHSKLLLPTPVLTARRLCFFCTCSISVLARQDNRIFGLGSIAGTG